MIFKFQELFSNIFSTTYLSILSGRDNNQELNNLSNHVSIEDSYIRDIVILGTKEYWKSFTNIRTIEMGESQLIHSISREVRINVTDLIGLL